MKYKCFIMRKSDLIINVVVYYDSKVACYEKEKVILWEKLHNY